MSADGPATLREQIRETVRLGRLEEAIELSEKAMDEARRSGDREAIDISLCNHANILASLNRCHEVIPKLRRVLMQNANPLIRFLAAYAISRHHDQNREVERGIFYARLALDHARRTDDPRHVGSAHNNLANLLVLDSLFAEAVEHYRASLERLDPDALPERALIKANLGYCHTILGDLDAAFRELGGSLRMVRGLENGSRLHAAHLAHLGLSYAYLETSRFDRARRHALRALELIETSEGAEEQHKNALFLLGEAEKLSGDTAAAFECFQRLQESFYPDEPFVVDVLLSTDIRHMINLMA